MNCFKDNKFKYGLSGKILVDQRSRLILSGGNRRDIEQLGASLTNTNDVLGRSLASSSLITVGSNTSLTNINLSTFALEIEPLKNFEVRFGGSYRTLRSASDQFSLDYYTNEEHTEIASEIDQTEISTILEISKSEYSKFFTLLRKFLDLLTSIRSIRPVDVKKV